MFTDRKVFRTLELDGLVVSPAFASAAIWGGNTSDSLRVQRIVAKAVKLELGGVALPPLDIDVPMTADGAVQSITLTNDERKLLAKIEPDGKRARIEVSAESLPSPFGTAFVLQEFAGKGILTANDLTFGEFEGRAFDGFLAGSMRIRWGQAWSLDGEINARQVDVSKIAGPLLSGGRLAGKGVYAARADTADKLLPAARMEGSFTVQKGTITNVDMTQALQGSGSSGGSTLFSEMSGGFLADAARVQVRNLRLSAGLLNASGGAEADAKGTVNGRIQVELRSQATQARATLSLSGTLAQPQFQRSN